MATADDKPTSLPPSVGGEWGNPIILDKNIAYSPVITGGEQPLPLPRTSENVPVVVDNNAKYKPAPNPQMRYKPATNPQMQYKPAPNPQMQYKPAPNPQMRYHPTANSQMQYKTAAQPQMRYNPSAQQPIQTKIASDASGLLTY